jgi:hypothetical protein
LARSMYCAGTPLNTIAHETGIRAATVANRAAEENWKRERDMVKSSSPNKSLQDLDSLGRLVRQKLAADALTTLERVEGYLMSDVGDETKREQVLGSVTKRAATVFGWSEDSAPVQVNVALLGALNDREPQPVDV